MSLIDLEAFKISMITKYYSGVPFYCTIVQNVDKKQSLNVAFSRCLEVFYSSLLLILKCGFFWAV
jgi:hypothetical protein